MEPRNLHQLFYLIAAAPWLLLALNHNPGFVLALACISIMGMAAGNMVRVARNDAERGVEQRVG